MNTITKLLLLGFFFSFQGAFSKSLSKRISSLRSKIDKAIKRPKSFFKETFLHAKKKAAPGQPITIIGDDLIALENSLKSVEQIHAKIKSLHWCHQKDLVKQVDETAKKNVGMFYKKKLRKRQQKKARNILRQAIEDQHKTSKTPLLDFVKTLQQEEITLAKLAQDTQKLAKKEAIKKAPTTITTLAKTIEELRNTIQLLDTLTGSLILK